MTRPRLVTAARVACGVAGLIMLGLTFTDEIALWKFNSRYDIFIGVLFGGMAVAAALALAGRQSVRAERILLLFAGGALLNWAYPPIEIPDGLPWQFWVGLGSAIVALVAALYLNIRAAAGSTDETLPPAGWYPDPGGSEQRRYWSGRAWTEGLR